MRRKAVQKQRDENPDPLLPWSANRQLSGYLAGAYWPSAVADDRPLAIA